MRNVRRYILQLWKKRRGSKSGRDCFSCGLPLLAVNVGKSPDECRKLPLSYALIRSLVAIGPCFFELIKCILNITAIITFLHHTVIRLQLTFTDGVFFP